MSSGATPAARASCHIVGWSEPPMWRSEEHTSELQSHVNIVCRLLLEKKKIAARRLGLKTTTLSEDIELDLALDGADQVQWRSLDLVKGGGAALCREKIVDSTTKKLVIIIDEKKLAKTLGGEQAIPVEITPFAYHATLAKINKISEKAALREAPSGKVGPVITDNGNLIIDAYYRNLRRPDIINEKLRKIPGVVETGLFLEMCDVAYVGRKDGRVDILRRS